MISPETCFHDLPGPLILESGEELPAVRVAYRTWGTLGRDGTNAVLVCHALTGSADADVWWGALFGPGRALDPDRDFIVCSNVLGGCSGTTGPAARADEAPGGRIWGPAFPAVTVRDLVRVQASLVEALGIRKLRLVLGGSLGGMQVLEWALLYPEKVEAIAPIAVSGRHSAWCIGLSEVQRRALAADPLWRDGRYSPEEPPSAGLAAARAVAMCTYRSRDSFETRFGRRLREPGLFEVESYLRHQGDKLVARFDANSYVTLSRAMDSHDVGRGRGSYEKALRSIRQPALVVAIDSDVLYPPEEQRELARLLPNSRLAWLHSPHGHDAFLIEGEALNRLLVEFRAAGSRAIPGRTRETVQVVLAGATGRVGSQLLAQLEGSGLRLVGASNSRRMAWDDDGLEPSAVADALDIGERNDWDLLAARILHSARAREEKVVFVDCTASPYLAERYETLLASGVAVVTPNKLANAGRLERWRRLRELSARAPYRYETTVGAALPVLGTLADLRRAGDRLLALSAILSGTLSFVLHRVGEGAAFSEAVAEAHRLGLTEPHPREDLTGEDVARKLLILLREAGFEVEREDILVEPLIPGGLPDEPDPERFLAALQSHDAAWAERAAARARGERLLHLARFDGAGPRVGLASVPADHPAARAGAGENVIVYHTDRYAAVPLTIAGPGAGPEITAAGVLIDLAAAAREMVKHTHPSLS